MNIYDECIATIRTIIILYLLDLLVLHVAFKLQVIKKLLREVSNNNGC